MLLAPLLLVGSGIYKRSFTSNGIVPMDVAQKHFEREEWTASSAKTAKGEEVLSELSNNGVLKARLRQLLSDTCR